MEKIFLFLLILLYGSASFSYTVKLNQEWSLEINNGNIIILHPGVLSEIPLKLTNSLFNMFDTHETIFKLSISNENTDIISSHQELILNPKENLTYSTYIGLKCNKYSFLYFLKILLFAKSSENSDYTKLKEFTLNIIINSKRTILQIDPIINEMPERSINYFKLGNEVYNTDEMQIVAINLGNILIFSNINIKPYLERGELSEKNSTNNGILFDSPFWAEKIYIQEKKSKIYLSFQNTKLESCFNLKYGNEIEVKKESPVKIDDKVKTAIKFNTEDQTSLYQITNSIKIKTQIPVSPSILSCEFKPSNSNASSKFYKNFIKDNYKFLYIIVDNLEANTEYNASCELSNTDYYDSTRNKINLTIGNFENADIVHQLIPSNDENRVPQCAKFYFNGKVEDSEKIHKLKTIGVNYCYYLMKTKEKFFFKLLPTLFCNSTEDSPEYITFCVAPLSLFNNGEYLTNQERDNYNGLFLQFISDMKKYIPGALGISFKNNVELIKDNEISKKSITATFVNEDNTNGKNLTIEIKSTHTQPVQCFYNDVLSNNCKFSQLKSPVILNPNESKNINVKINKPENNKMYSLNVKCFNALPNFNFRYKTTGVMSIFTYLNLYDEGKFNPSSNQNDYKDDINTNTTINCNDKKNMRNPRCIIDEFVPIFEKLTTDIPAYFKEIENLVQLYSKMLTSQKNRYLSILDNKIFPKEQKQQQNLTLLFEKIIELTKYLTYTDCSVYSSGSSNKEEETIKNEKYVICRENKQYYLAKVINILKEQLNINDCNSLNDTIFSRLSHDAEINLKYALFLINELSNNPESYKNGSSQDLFDATVCIQENFDKYWTEVEAQLNEKKQLNSSIFAIKKDALYILLRTLTNLAKVIHFDEIDGYINSTKTKTGLILNETYINIQKKIIVLSKKLNDFGDEYYSLSGSMLSKIITYKHSNESLENQTELISVPNKNIFIRIYYNYMLEKNNAKTLQVLVFDSPLVSIKTSGGAEKTSDSVNTFISIILFNEYGEEIPIKSIKEEYRPQILYLKSKYQSLKKCFYYNEIKQELETDGVIIDENYEYNGEKYIKCASNHLTAFTAGTYDFNAKIPWWVVLLIVSIILIALIVFISIFIIVKKKSKSRFSYRNINSQFSKKESLLDY